MIVKKFGLQYFERNWNVSGNWRIPECYAVAVVKNSNYHWASTSQNI